MRIANKVALYMSIFIIIGFSIFITLNYHSSNKDIFTAIGVSKQESVMNVKSFVDGFFDNKVDFVEALAKQIEQSDLSNESIGHILEHSFPYAKVSSLFFGYEKDGLLVTIDDANNHYYNLKNFDSRTRDWYKEGKQKRAPGLSQAYNDVRTNKLQVTSYAPVIVNGELIGIVGSGIFLDILQSEFKELIENEIAVVEGELFATEGRELRTGKILQVLRITDGEDSITAKIFLNSPEEFDVKVGDHVLFAKYSGVDVEEDGEKCLLLAERDILGIL